MLIEIKDGGEHLTKFAAERGIEWRDMTSRAANMLGNLAEAIETTLDVWKTRMDTDSMKEAMTKRKIYVKIRRVHKGEIPPDLDSSSHYLRITFTDNGCGIPLSEKDRIFAPFYTTYPHGSGLGLAIVKWIIEAHNGMIIEEGRWKNAQYPNS